MKALLLKDYYVLTRQMKIFLLMIVIFSCLPGYSTSTFAIVYASMLPVTALAYDERSKWDNLAMMMPYSSRDMVLSKYVLGYIGVLGATLITIVIGVIMNAVGLSELNTDSIGMICGGIFSGILILALSLPMMFKFGVEKGRIAFFIIIAVVVAVGITAGNLLLSYVSYLENLKGSIVGIMGVGVLILVVVSIISVYLSIKFFESKK